MIPCDGEGLVRNPSHEDGLKTGGSLRADPVLFPSTIREPLGPHPIWRKHRAQNENKQAWGLSDYTSTTCSPETKASA